MSEFKRLQLNISDGLATITLSRPEAGNALDIVACEEFEQAANSIAAAGAAVRAILLAATGKSFCVGGDVSSMVGVAVDKISPVIVSMAAPLGRGIATLGRLDAPLVAAVRGAAAGAGLSLVADADIVVASSTAKFTMAYTGIGLSPDGGGTWGLPRVIGIRRATELALTNRLLSAEEALQWGLVSKVVADEALDNEALTLARQLANGPTLAYGIIRRLLDRSLASDREAQLDAELKAIAISAASADAAEGISAFTSRRPPRFCGK